MLPLLFYSPGSAPSRSVMMLARAIGVQLDIRLVNITNQQAENRAFSDGLATQHVLPNFQHGPSNFTKTYHIFSYLIEKFGNIEHQLLYPGQPLHIRTRIDERILYESDIMSPVSMDIFAAYMVRGEPQPSARHRDAANEIYDQLERFLGNNQYMAGDEMTVADLALITAATQLDMRVPFDREQFERLTEWIDRMAELPYYQELNMIILVKYMKWADEMFAQRVEIAGRLRRADADELAEE